MRKTALLLTAILAFTAASLYAQNAQSRLDNGKKLADQGDYDGAIKEYTEAIRLDPKNADAYYFRGTAYGFKNDYNHAISDYTEYIRLKPKVTRGYFARGLAYYYKKDYDRAIADFTEYIRFEPKYANAYYYRGGAYGFKNDYDRAIVDFTEYIRLEPKDINGYIARGAVYAEKEDYDHAVADYEAALRINPNHSVARDILAEIKLYADNQNDSSQSTTGVISVTAKDLESAYDSNQLRADTQYLNKTIKVTGKVVEVAKNGYGYYIALDTKSVCVYFQSSELNRAIALNKGQTVTLTGICKGYGGFIRINDAVFSN